MLDGLYLVNNAGLRIKKRTTEFTSDDYETIHVATFYPITANFKVVGVCFDGAGFGLGTRSQRYAAVIEDGTITKLEVEPGPGVNASSCENILSKL